jgi:hypothetical protein
VLHFVDQLGVRCHLSRILVVGGLGQSGRHNYSFSLVLLPSVEQVMMRDATRCCSSGRPTANEQDHDVRCPDG